MQHQLAEVGKAFERAQARLEKVAGNLSEERWALRSDPDRWSVAECIAHLNLTSAAYIPRIRQALTEARALPPVSAKEYRRDAAGWFFSVMVGPLPSLGRFRIGRVKTPPKFVPAGGQPRQNILSGFKRDQDELIGMVREADDLPIDRVWIRSPFGEKIRYNCYSAFVILSRHQERHLDQAELVWSDRRTEPA